MRVPICRRVCSAFGRRLTFRTPVDYLEAGQYPVHVKSITYTAARENLASTINRVCEDHAPSLITKNRDQSS